MLIHVMLPWRQVLDRFFYPPFRDLFVPHISGSKPDCKYSHKNSYIFDVTLRKMIIRSQLELGLPVVLLGYSDTTIPWHREGGEGGGVGEYFSPQTKLSICRTSNATYPKWAPFGSR